jgi:hypothetical protein
VIAAGCTFWRGGRPVRASITVQISLTRRCAPDPVGSRACGCSMIVIRCTLLH